MAGGVRVLDMSSKYFMFTFMSTKEASRILEERSWVFNQLSMFLD